MYSIACERSGKRSGVGRKLNESEWSGEGVRENDGAGAERGAAVMEQVQGCERTKLAAQISLEGDRERDRCKKKIENVN